MHVEMPKVPDEIIRRAQARFGWKSQLMVLGEEAAELAAAVARRLNDKERTGQEVVDELADVLIMADQAEWMFSRRAIVEAKTRKLAKFVARLDALDRTKGPPGWQGPPPTEEQLRQKEAAAWGGWDQALGIPHKPQQLCAAQLTNDEPVNRGQLFWFRMGSDTGQGWEPYDGKPCRIVRVVGHDRVDVCFDLNADLDNCRYFTAFKRMLYGAGLSEQPRPYHLPFASGGVVRKEEPVAPPTWWSMPRAPRWARDEIMGLADQCDKQQWLNVAYRAREIMERAGREFPGDKTRLPKFDAEPDRVRELASEIATATTTLYDSLDRLGGPKYALQGGTLGEAVRQTVAFAKLLKAKNAAVETERDEARRIVESSFDQANKLALLVDMNQWPRTNMMSVANFLFTIADMAQSKIDKLKTESVTASEACALSAKTTLRLKDERDLATAQRDKYAHEIEGIVDVLSTDALQAGEPQDLKPVERVHALVKLVQNARRERTERAVMEARMAEYVQERDAAKVRGNALHRRAQAAESKARKLDPNRLKNIEARYLTQLGRLHERHAIEKERLRVRNLEGLKAIKAALGDADTEPNNYFPGVIAKQVSELRIKKGAAHDNGVPVDGLSDMPSQDGERVRSEVKDVRQASGLVAAPVPSQDGQKQADAGGMWLGGRWVASAPVPKIEAVVEGIPYENADEHDREVLHVLKSAGIEGVVKGSEMWTLVATLVGMANRKEFPKP